MHDKNYEWIVSSIVAGSVSGIVLKTMLAPIDRVRVNYQVNQLKFTYRHAGCTVRRFLNEEGLKGLFRGNSASVYRVIPYFAIQFWTHEQLKSGLMVRTYEQKVANPCMSLAAGIVSGGLAVACTYPLDVARARLATDRSYKSIYSVFERAVISKQARYGLYRGFSSAALAVIPHSCISFHIYEIAKMHYFPETGTGVVYRSQDVFMRNLALGCGIAFIGETLIYPLDTVRRRMQVDVVHDELTFRQAWCNVYQQFGWRGYYKAITLSWLKMPFTVGIGLATFDFCYNHIHEFLVEAPEILSKFNVNPSNIRKNAPKIPTILKIDIKSAVEETGKIDVKKIVLADRERKLELERAKLEAASAIREAAQTTAKVLSDAVESTTETVLNVIKLEPDGSRAFHLKDVLNYQIFEAKSVKVHKRPVFDYANGGYASESMDVVIKPYEVDKIWLEDVLNNKIYDADSAKVEEEYANF